MYPALGRRLLALLGLLFGCASTRPPNIILILTDDQGHGDIGVHGNDKIRTPNLDRFAREGIEFSRLYTSPVCSPTRAALMTGRYYYRTGVIHTSRGGAKMHGDEVTGAERLRATGYRTGIFGKWHLGDTYPMRPQDQGFDEVLIHKSGGIGTGPDSPSNYFNPRLWHNGVAHLTSGYCTDVFFEAASAFIEARRAEPFFVYLPTNAPHAPLDVPDGYVEPYRKMGLDDTTARVYAMVQNIDDNIGKLLQRLEALGLRDDTVVMFLSDNGAQQERFNAGLRGRKGWTYEGGIRSNAFVQWPGHWQGGRKIDRIAADIDVVPTLLDVAGVPRPEPPELDGVSLVPLLSGRADAGSWPERTLFAQSHRGLEPKLFQNAAAITQRWKLVATPGTFNAEDLVTSATDPKMELYDIEADPAESHDRAREEPQRLTALRAEYERWFADVKATRGMQPGWIHLGSPHENPVHLSRYQDGNFKNDVSHGWSVVVEATARYELAYELGDAKAAGRLLVAWAGSTQTRPLPAGQSTTQVELAAGRGVLEIWFEEDGKGRVMPVKEEATGDVRVRRLDIR